MPTPVSLTLMRRSSSCAPRSMRSRISPLGVNFTALPSKLSSTWRKRAASPWRHVTTSGCTIHANSSPLARAVSAAVASAASMQSNR